MFGNTFLKDQFSLLTSCFGVPILLILHEHISDPLILPLLIKQQIHNY